MQRGRGYKPTFWERYIDEYHDKGLDSEVIAYKVGMEGDEVRKYLGRKLDRERESKAKEKATKSAWRRIVEKGENFFKVRDSLKINTLYLHQLLREESLRRGEENRSYDLAYESRHDYAVLVYEESDKCLWDVSKALEVRSKEAKQILDDDYDPYAEYHWDEQAAVIEKAKSLYENGKSYAQIDWILRNECIDSESILNPKPLSPWELSLRKELHERLETGEHLDSISSDTGVSEWNLLKMLEGEYKHPLDYYGLGSDKRKILGRLYLDDGYEPDEIAVLMKTDEKSVHRCIEEFYYRYSDEDRHSESSRRRWSNPKAERISQPKIVLDPEEEADRHRIKSAETANRCGINESRATKFFEGGLLPTRAEIAQSRDARAGISRAMFDQEKSIEEIMAAVGVSEATIRLYLAKELAEIREDESKSRENVSREELKNAAYASRAPKSGGTPIPGKQTEVLVIPRLQPRILGYWYAARQCEARRLIAFCGFSVIEAANIMGMSPSKLKVELGSFAERPQSLKKLRMHALIIYFYDCLLMEHDEIAQILGIETSDVFEYLRDGRWVPSSPWWREPWRCGKLSPEQLADACSLDKKLLERASNLGLFSSEDKYPSSYVRSFDALEAMGLFNPKPFNYAILMEECDD